jgi:hypothetical protein
MNDAVVVGLTGGAVAGVSRRVVAVNDFNAHLF